MKKKKTSKFICEQDCNKKGCYYSTPRSKHHDNGRPIEDGDEILCLISPDTFVLVPYK